jgi:hypothetical protein
MKLANAVKQNLKKMPSTHTSAVLRKTVTGFDFTEHRPNWWKKQGSPSPESPHLFDMNVNCCSRYILYEEAVFDSCRRRGLAGPRVPESTCVIIREHRNYPGRFRIPHSVQCHI